MKPARALLIALALLLLPASAPALAGDGNDQGGKRANVVAYFIEWGVYGRQYFVKNVATSGSASRLSVLNYAFANVTPGAGGNVKCALADEWADYQRPISAAESVDGQEVTWPRPLLGNFQQLQVLKAQNPGLKVLISLGGWTLSKYFSVAAATQASREAFVSSCIDLFIKGNIPDPGWGGMGGPGAAVGLFDGIDIDWEWPGSEGNAGNVISPADKTNLTLLLAEFRRQLDRYGQETKRHYLLTQFLPAAPAKIDAGFEVDKIFRYLDFGTVQGYDLHGAWESTTNHQSNLFAAPGDPADPHFSVADTVKAYLRRGAPSEDLVVGVPFYSHGWTGVTPANHGLFQPSSGPAPATWEAGTEDYKVAKTFLGNGFTRYADRRAGADWLFDGTTFWTFDDPSVMTQKAHYVTDNDLGGIMFWELSGDTADGELIHAISAGLSEDQDG
jgi:chitinase